MVSKGYSRFCFPFILAALILTFTVVLAFRLDYKHGSSYMPGEKMKIAPSSCVWQPSTKVRRSRSNAAGKAANADGGEGKSEKYKTAESYAGSSSEDHLSSALLKIEKYFQEGRAINGRILASQKQRDCVVDPINLYDPSLILREQAATSSPLDFPFNLDNISVTILRKDLLFSSLNSSNLRRGMPIVFKFKQQAKQLMSGNIVLYGIEYEPNQADMELRFNAIISKLASQPTDEACILDWTKRKNCVILLVCENYAFARIGSEDLIGALPRRQLPYHIKIGDTVLAHITKIDFLSSVIPLNSPENDVFGNMAKRPRSTPTDYTALTHQKDTNIAHFKRRAFHNSLQSNEVIFNTRVMSPSGNTSYNVALDPENLKRLSSFSLASSVSSSSASPSSASSSPSPRVIMLSSEPHPELLKGIDRVEKLSKDFTMNKIVLGPSTANSPRAMNEKGSDKSQQTAADFKMNALPSHLKYERDRYSDLLEDELATVLGERGYKRLSMERNLQYHYDELLEELQFCDRNGLFPCDIAEWVQSPEHQNKLTLNFLKEFEHDMQSNLNLLDAVDPVKLLKKFASFDEILISSAGDPERFELASKVTREIHGESLIDKAEILNAEGHSEEVKQHLLKILIYQRKDLVEYAIQLAKQRNSDLSEFARSLIHQHKGTGSKLVLGKPPPLNEVEIPPGWGAGALNPESIYGTQKMKEAGMNEQLLQRIRKYERLIKRTLNPPSREIMFDYQIPDDAVYLHTQQDGEKLQGLRSPDKVPINELFLPFVT